METTSRLFSKLFTSTRGYPTPRIHYNNIILCTLYIYRACHCHCCGIVISHSFVYPRNTAIGIIFLPYTIFAITIYISCVLFKKIFACVVLTYLVCYRPHQGSDVVTTSVDWISPSSSSNPTVEIIRYTS
jgi:hypothetical protein